MKKAADIGYKTVQISAVGPIVPDDPVADAKLIKEICDENGIKVIVTHEPMEKILDDPEAEEVRGVNDEDDALHLVVVIPPHRSK